MKENRRIAVRVFAPYTIFHAFEDTLCFVVHAGAFLQSRLRDGVDDFSGKIMCSFPASRK